MFGIANLQPWVGSDYGRQQPKIMVVGETGHGKDTDKQIVTDLCNPLQPSNTWNGFPRRRRGT